eukprot:s2882_g6.t1
MGSDEYSWGLSAHGLHLRRVQKMPWCRQKVYHKLSTSAHKHGPAAVVGDFVQFISAFRPVRPSSPEQSVGSFEVVSSAPSEPAPRVVSGIETRDQILSTFRPCPSDLRQLGVKLVGASLSGASRIDRAWVAGCWARAVLDQRIHSPNRTPPLDLRSRFYAVVRANSVDCPVIFKSSASYWRALGTLEGSNSISQSFPSESEAKVYLLAAGFEADDIRVLP